MSQDKRKRIGLIVLVAALVGALAGYFVWQSVWKRDPAFEQEKAKIDAGWDELEAITNAQEAGAE